MKYLLFALCCLVYEVSRAQDSRDNWADLAKYEKQNAALRTAGPDDKRVVFMGSSIVEFWKQLDPAYFEKNHYVDRGISGQISAQMLIRFQADVVDLKPRAVVILAGSNDIAMDTAAYMYKRIMDNIRSMAELARQNHIKVILCTYLPIAEYPWRKGIHPGPRIVRLNSLIARYASQEHLMLLDDYTPLVDQHQGQRKDLTRDGVHPNLKGYRLLEGPTDAAIAEVLKD